jgi:cytochrome c553
MTPQAIFLIVKNGSGKPNTAMTPWATVLPDALIRDVSEYAANLAAEGRRARGAAGADAGRP